MTGELTEHMDINNEYATLQEPEDFTKEVPGSANEIATSSDATKEISNTNDVAVL